VDPFAEADRVDPPSHSRDHPTPYELGDSRRGDTTGRQVGAAYEPAVRPRAFRDRCHVHAGTINDLARKNRVRHDIVDGEPPVHSRPTIHF